MIERIDNIFKFSLTQNPMLMTIGLVNGELVLTHLSFLFYNVITVGMRGKPNFLRLLTKNYTCLEKYNFIK